MTTDNTAVFVDQDVTPQILSVIDKASKQVIIVTPYLDLWRQARMAIERAVKRGIDTRFIIRKDDKEGLGGRGGEKDVQWLLENKVKVYAMEGLHAKIYLNEETTLLSSMNMTEPSTTNSMEIAVRLRDPQDQKTVRGYVRRLLTQDAQLLTQPVFLDPQKKRAAGPTIGIGLCIRCRRKLNFDPDYPLCNDCYGIWAEYENEDYTEKFCHSCGKPEDVSYAKPLCRTCYASLH